MPRGLRKPGSEPTRAFSVEPPARGIPTNLSARQIEEIVTLKELLYATYKAVNMIRWIIVSWVALTLLGAIIALLVVIAAASGSTGA